MALQPIQAGILEDAEGKPIDLPSPEPVPDQATYDAERERALAFSDKRRDNYERYMASGRRGVEVDYLPVRLDLENVSRCNFRCTMCQVSEWDKGKRARDLSLDEFKSLIDEQYGLVEIKLQGMGEPTMQGDDFFEMIRYARERAIWVRTVTNASLLHLKNNAEKLIDSGVNEVQISIDGADKETYESIRQGSVFEQVVENCKRINAYCAEKDIERTKMWTVVQRSNQHQIEELIHLGKEMGFRHLVFSLNLVDWGADEWRDRNANATIEHLFPNAKALEYIKLGDELGLKVRFWRQTDKYDTNAPSSLCPWPFERGYVSSDMRIVPCCVLGNPEVADLGDANHFSDVWYGDVWKAFRQRHLDGDIPKYCQACYKGFDDEA